MYQVIIVIHVLLGLGIIGLILMQQGKGADAGAAFGTGSAGSVFGAQGAASFLSRTTAILAGLFFLTSLSLAVINGHKGTVYDLMSSPETQQETVAPAAESTVPTIKAEEVPVVPEVKLAEPAKDPAIQATEVPKPEPLKTVEDPAKK
ncbi:MAG: preprotein translocase subunit SecG [Methylococcaceae bacterium]|nr:preprotein translocase subunit SecG [Methylococcaceae bacterium]